MFASAKVPLTTWLRVMYTITQTKQGISSIELGRTPGATVVTDGLTCFRGLTDAGCERVALPTGSCRRAVRHPSFQWVNTMFGNIKKAIVGTYRSVSKKHIVRTPAEFEWRFNHREIIAAMIPSSPAPRREQNRSPTGISRWLIIVRNQELSCFSMTDC